MAKTVDVGAQDLELKNSPIAIEGDEETFTLREQIPGEAFCYFNAEVFEQGAMIKSGTMLLHCDRGIWIPAGPSDPDNP